MYTFYGSPLGHGIVDQCNGFNCDIRDQCKKFEISTSQKEPPTNYKIDENAEYECYASGGYIGSSGGVEVGNTSVNCAVTWVVSWFPQARITLKFVNTPVCFENPNPIKQICTNL